MSSAKGVTVPIQESEPAGHASIGSGLSIRTSDLSNNMAMKGSKTEVRIMKMAFGRVQLVLYSIIGTGKC